MHTASILKQNNKEIWIAAAGSALIVLGASFKIPFYPVSFTLQTLALYIIALTHSPKQALAAVCGYLVLGCLGLPVFGLHANPYWWMGRCGGYFWAFPFATYAMAKMRSRIGTFSALAIGNFFILLCGFLWLIPFIGPSNALIKGALIFIPSEFAKILAALYVLKWSQK